MGIIPILILAGLSANPPRLISAAMFMENRRCPQHQGVFMSLLIFMRHGQSMWNAAKLFTGWVDVPLTNIGIEEAIEGGKKIAHLDMDEVHVFNPDPRSNDGHARTRSTRSGENARVPIPSTGRRHILCFGKRGSND